MQRIASISTQVWTDGFDKLVCFLKQEVCYWKRKNTQRGCVISLTQRAEVPVKLLRLTRKKGFGEWEREGQREGVYQSDGIRKDLARSYEKDKQQFQYLKIPFASTEELIHWRAYGSCTWIQPRSHLAQRQRGRKSKGLDGGARKKKILSNRHSDIEESFNYRQRDVK